MHFNSRVKSAMLASLLGCLGTLHSHAQFAFSSGSDGCYGAMNITTNTTLALPADGIFNCTTITVASNATLRFTSNALNTPVYLLAASDVTINGTIDVSGSANNGVWGGAGGPGGFAGGRGPYSSLPAGDGMGPGAGRGGNGTTAPLVGAAAYATSGTSYYGTINNGAIYGSPLLIPPVGGSGGGGSSSEGDGGMGGGGAILIASSTRITVPGNLSATSPSVGGYGNFGLGSGGAIRLVAPVIAGTGSLNVQGGKNIFLSGIGAGSGRIRIDCMDRRSLALNLSGSSCIGANMVTSPTNLPHLDITQVAGTNILVATGAPVSFTLPQGSSTNQTVVVQASNFGTNVAIRVVLTPDSGSSSSYDTQIDNSANNPASVTVPVVVPVNVQVQVNAWTR